MTTNLDKKNQCRLLKGVDILFSNEPVEYIEAVSFMEERVKSIHSGDASELVWFLEHPSVYTAGTSANDSELLSKKRFPVYSTGRGGRYTYHGPGQRIVYIMLDLTKRGNDVKKFVHDLEKWVIKTLLHFNVIGEVHDDRIGIWVKHGATHNPKSSVKKIAAIGIRVRHGITFHGVAINIDPNLEHFSGIIPCGIKDHGVTSLWDLGLTTSTEEFDTAMVSMFSKFFNI